jgi:hypothetical protein
MKTAILVILLCGSMSFVGLLALKAVKGASGVPDGPVINLPAS